MEKILIIDDEAFIRENVERILGEEGYQVLAVPGGCNEQRPRSLCQKIVTTVALCRRAESGSDLETAGVEEAVSSEFVVGQVFGNDIGLAFRMTFLNKCDELERGTVAEFYQRAFGTDLPESTARVRVA